MKTADPEPVDDQKRHCYCRLWHEHREVLEKQNLPYGFCGWCKCGKAGHTRHAPRGPMTASWCDECWAKLIMELEAERKIPPGLRA